MGPFLYVEVYVVRHVYYSQVGEGIYLDPLTISYASRAIRDYVTHDRALTPILSHFCFRMHFPQCKCPVSFLRLVVVLFLLLPFLSSPNLVFSLEQRHKCFKGLS